MSFSGGSAQQQVELRDTLFGDMPVEQWVGDGSPSQEYPWNVFVAARSDMEKGNGEAAVQRWREIVNHPGLEPRHYVQAWHFLRMAGHQPPAECSKQVLGVVVEVGMEEGLDLLAAYPDYSARYYNFSGAGVVWEHPNDMMNEKINALLVASSLVVAHIGPWKSARPPAPLTGQVRLCFLTP